MYKPVCPQQSCTHLVESTLSSARLICSHNIQKSCNVNSSLHRHLNVISNSNAAKTGNRGTLTNFIMTLRLFVLALRCNFAYNMLGLSN